MVSTIIKYVYNIDLKNLLYLMADAKQAKTFHFYIYFSN